MIKEKTPTRKQIIHRLNEGDRYLMRLQQVEDHMSRITAIVT
jgi:predicted RNA-binding protein YlxR (DUF448 family)